MTRLGLLLAPAPALAAESHAERILFDGGGESLNGVTYHSCSTDNGVTWSALSEVIGSGQGVWGNPTAVVDRSNNRIWLFMNYQPPTSGTVDSWEDRQVWVSSSTNERGVGDAVPRRRPARLAFMNSAHWSR